MNRILFCWELGSNLGHVMRLLPIARVLRDKGHEVLWAYAGIRKTVASLVRSEGFTSLDAPTWPLPATSSPLSQTYGQNLLKNGYGREDYLLSHLDAWRSLLQSSQPDLVLAEHAPTALIIARDMDITRAAIGTGYSIPPLSRPMSFLHPWFTLSAERLAEKEAAFLNKVNQVLAEAGCVSLGSVADIFDGASIFLCTWPEFDHYGGRETEKYRGPVVSDVHDLSAPWPSQDRENVYVYMRSGHRVFQPLLEALQKLDLPVLAFVPDINVNHMEQIGTGKNTCITASPMNLGDVKERCLFAVTEGGVNTASLMLLAGVPLLLCPSQLEQAVLSYRLSAQGLCTMISWFDMNPDMEGKVNEMYTNDLLVKNVRALAHKYSDESNAGRVEDIAQQCLLLAEAC